jgi:hypothetical protein
MSKINNCLVCGTPIKVSREGRKKFCSSSCRAIAWRSGLIVQPCFYCGVPADTIDHSPPRAARASILDAGLQKRYPFEEVDCCRECNGLLGYRGLWTLPLRKKFIRRILRWKYRRLLAQPIWTETQLSELGYSLRTFVEHRARQKEILLQRLKW